MFQNKAKCKVDAFLDEEEKISIINSLKVLCVYGQNIHMEQNVWNIWFHC